MRELAVHQTRDHRLRGRETLAEEITRRVLDGLRQARVSLQILRGDELPRNTPELIVHQPRALLAWIRHLPDRLLDKVLEGLLRQQEHRFGARSVLNRRADVFLGHRLVGVQALETLDEDVLQDEMNTSPALERRRVEVLVLPRHALRERRRVPVKLFQHHRRLTRGVLRAPVAERRELALRLALTRDEILSWSSGNSLAM